GPRQAFGRTLEPEQRDRDHRLRGGLARPWPGPGRRALTRRIRLAGVRTPPPETPPPPGPRRLQRLHPPPPGTAPRLGRKTGPPHTGGPAHPVARPVPAAALSAGSCRGDHPFRLRLPHPARSLGRGTGTLRRGLNALRTSPCSDSQRREGPRLPVRRGGV